MNRTRKLLRKVSWRSRSMLGVASGDNHEILYRLSRLPEVPGPSAVFRFPWGSVEYVATSDLRGQFSEIFVHRHYAFRPEVADPVIIDGGGNIGLSAIWFKRAYPNARLTVYEADPALASILQRNVAAAGFSDVTVKNAAVWHRAGTVSFDNRGQDKGMVAPRGGIEVSAIDLAATLPERVDLLKLDIEGAEFPVVESLCQTGAIARVRNFVAEYHIRRDDTDRFLQSIRSLRAAGMQVIWNSAIGPWLGAADAVSPFEIVGQSQGLAEVYAWR